MRHLVEFLETREVKANKEADVEAKMLVLKKAWDKADEADRKHLDEMFDSLNKEWLWLRKTKEWMFGFIGGGWNTIMAGDKETAIELAIEEYKNSSNCNVDVKTFKVVELNRMAYESALRSFY